MTVRSADIEAAVREEFTGSGGWTAARYLSPDIMIAADGAEAVARGDFTLVLGELHLAANTLGASSSPTSTRTPTNCSVSPTGTTPGRACCR